MRDFIVEDYKEKRKSFKSRQEQSRRRRLAAPFVLDEASVTFRPPSGYYGQFGDKDSSYVDHRDFDNNSENNEFSDHDSDEEMALGDDTLQSNINKQISLLEEDDIDLDVFENPIALRSPPSRKERTRGRRGRGRGRGSKVESSRQNIKLLGNESAFTGENELQVYGATGDTSPERFSNGSFFNTELPSAKLDDDVFTDEASQEVAAEIHPEPPALRLQGDNVAVMDDALIVHYNDQLYLVDPAPHPGQPVLFVNGGGEMNGVFVKGKSGDNAESVVYELDNSLSKKASDNEVSNSLSKKPSDNEGDQVSNSLSKKPSDNDGDEVTHSLCKQLDSFSDEHYIPGKGFLSADEDKISPKISRVIKKDGCKTDSELERFEVIKYKTEEVTKPDVKSDTNRDVMKQDVVTEGKLDKNMPSAVNDNSQHAAVTQPDGVTKYRTETKSDAGTKFDSKGHYCNVCHSSFWTEGGLRQHSSSHNKTSLFDQDRHKEELDAECKTVESKQEKPKEKIENGNEGTNGNEGMNGNEGKNPEVIVLESSSDEPNETTEKNIQSNNAADKDNEISDNSEEKKIDPKDSDIEILEVIREPKVTEVVEIESESNGDAIKDNNEQKKLTESKSEVTDEVKMKTENEVTDDNVKKGEPNNNEGTKPVEVENIEPKNNEGERNNNKGMKPVEVENIEPKNNEGERNNNEGTKPVEVENIEPKNNEGQTITKERNLLK